MADHPHYRLDDLRRLGAAMLAGSGVAPERASAFMSSLLWYEAADAAEFGIGSLPAWLDALKTGEIDPKAAGTIVREHTATAVLDGGRGLAPLILARAAGVAQEKAREVGVGMVRVVNLGRVGASAEVAAEIAIGPMVGEVRGPEGSLAVSAPVEGSMPAVFDSALAPDPRQVVPPWADGADAWLVTARAVASFESLASIHEEVGTLLAGNPPRPGEVRPDAWQARRSEHLDRGLALSKATVAELRRWSKTLGVAWPESS